MEAREEPRRLEVEVVRELSTGSRAGVVATLRLKRIHGGCSHSKADVGGLHKFECHEEAEQEQDAGG